MSPILSIYESKRFFTYGTIFRICTFRNKRINSQKKSTFKIFKFLQFCQSTNLHGFSPMVQYSGSVHLEIKELTAKKNPPLKFLSFSNFSNFVNLQFYTDFHLWYNIQDLFIWKSTNLKQKIQL